MFAVGILYQPGSRRFERAWFTKDVARVDDTEFFLRKTALVGAVGVYRAERVPRKGVSELCYLRSGVAKGSQDFSQRGIFPTSHGLGERANRAAQGHTR